MTVQERLEAEDRALLNRLSVGTVQRIRVEDRHWIWVGSWSTGGRTHTPIINGNSIRVGLYCQLVDQAGGTEMVTRTCDSGACVHPHHMTVQPKGRCGFRGKA